MRRSVQGTPWQGVGRVFRLLLLAALFAPASAYAAADGREVALQRAGDVLGRCVVTVDAYNEETREPMHRRGMGVLVTHSGHVFTPMFVVAGADAVIVSFDGDSRAPARVLGADPETQLAVLKISFVPDEVLCPDLADEEAERADTPVVMIVRAAERCEVLPGSVKGLRAEVGPLKNVLEVEVTGAPSPLGGVLLNAEGELVGLALAARDAETAEGAEGAEGAAEAPGPEKTRVFVLPASKIRAAVDRMLKQAQEENRPQERMITA